MRNEETVSSRDSTSFAFQESIAPDFFCDGLKSFIKSQWAYRYLYSRVYSCKGPNWKSRTHAHMQCPHMLSPLTCAAGQVTQGELCLLWSADAKKRAQIRFFFFFFGVHSLLLDPTQKALSSTQLEVIRALGWSAHTQGGWAGEAAMRQKKRSRGRREELWGKRRSLDQPVCLSQETPKDTTEGTNHGVNVSQPQQTGETTWRFPCRNKTLDTRSKHNKKKSTKLTSYLSCVSSHADATNMKTQTGWKCLCWSCAVNLHLF